MRQGSKLILRAADESKNFFRCDPKKLQAGGIPKNQDDLWGGRQGLNVTDRVVRVWGLPNFFAMHFVMSKCPKVQNESNSAPVSPWARRSNPRIKRAFIHSSLLLGLGRSGEPKSQESGGNPRKGPVRANPRAREYFGGRPGEGPVVHGASALTPEQFERNLARIRCHHSRPGCADPGTEHLFDADFFRHAFCDVQMSKSPIQSGKLGGGCWNFSQVTC